MRHDGDALDPVAALEAIEWRGKRNAAPDSFAGGLPAIRPADLDNRPTLRPALIEGVARTGALIEVTAPSKAGKTWLLMELAVAFATGGKWLGWQCRRGRSLYLDGELWPDEWLDRLARVAGCEDAGADEVRDGIDLLSMRGRARDLREIEHSLVCAAQGGGYEAVIIDPAYIFSSGDENRAGDVRDFMNSLAAVGRGCGCAVVFSHHHSKGAKGDAASIDRGSGSGVFGRYPDAIIDLIELVPQEDADAREYGLRDGARAFRVSATLRSFPPIEPFGCWFRCPVHVKDEEGVLDALDPMTEARRGGMARGRQTKRDAASRWDAAETAIVCEMDRRGVDRLPTCEAQAAAGYNDRQTFTRAVDGSAMFRRELVRGKESFVVRRE